jgi:hypothetical protein
MFQLQNRHIFSVLLVMFTIIATQSDGLALTKYSDFNGDGYSDLASGLPQADVETTFSRDSIKSVVFFLASPPNYG